MRIDVWSDVVCPWCYIGKRRLEKALTAFESEHPENDIEVVWRSFELDPSAPEVPVESVAQALGRKYGGGPDAGRSMVDRVEAVAAEEGMVWRHHSSLRVNTVTAHRLLHWALHEGGPELQGRLKQELLAAYFERELNIADVETLLDLTASVGLDRERARAVIESREFADEVEADVREAAALGATGVPFFVIDQKYGISGAQPVEFFTQVIERAWNESRPLMLVSPEVEEREARHETEEAVCGPDGCVIS
ncbi:MAG: DsbA family oxidoreductase [Marmoricola sp.]